MEEDEADYNVDNYEINELVDIIGLDYPVTKDDIEDASLFLIKQYTQSKEPLMVAFVKDVREKLEEYLFENHIDEILREEHGIMTTFAKKPTKENATFVQDREDHNVTIVNEDHQTMQQNRVNFPLNPRQGFMNKILRNTDTKIINIDSHYRDNLLLDASGYNAKSSSTDFMVNFNEPLVNVLSMKLFSYEIPVHWYTFSEKYGTNRFMIDNSSVVIPDGNYTASELIADISSALTAAGTGCGISLNTKTNRVTITTGSTSKKISFYNDTLFNAHHSTYCGIKYNTSERSGPKIDYNLGWLLGFRKTTYTGAISYPGEALIDTAGIKYLYITLDDFNHHHNAKQVTNLYQDKETLKLPSYYKYYKDSDCVPANVPVDTNERSDAGNKLTQAQLFAINQILLDNASSDLDRHTGNVDSDIIARIQVPFTNGNSFRYLINQESSLANNSRQYYGPVTIKRMRVRLVDDKGNDIDLNNMDWSFSLIVEQLYEY
jgi:hypothetical protein